MNGYLDDLILTGDIGWDQPEVAEAIARGLGDLGIQSGLSRERSRDVVISVPTARIPVMAIRPREELSLAAAATAAL